MIRRLATGCWVADCDRCERPAVCDCGWVGTTRCAEQVAHALTPELLRAALAEAGWAVVGSGLCCPDCAGLGGPAARVRRVPVRVRAGPAIRQVWGELTACAQLVIVAHRDTDGAWLGVHLLHLPTGRHIPNVTGAPVRVLHRVAELVAHLDWSNPEPAHYTSGYPDHIQAALSTAHTEADPTVGGGS